MERNVSILAGIRYSQVQMGSAIVLAAMLFVFFVRDVQLLAAPPRGGSWARLSLYGGVNVIYLTTTTAILVSTGSYSPLQLIHTSPLWLLIVVLALPDLAALPGVASEREK